MSQAVFIQFKSKYLYSFVLTSFSFIINVLCIRTKLSGYYYDYICIYKCTYTYCFTIWHYIELLDDTLLNFGQTIHYIACIMINLNLYKNI